MKVAILVDGGFYRKRARCLFGDKSPDDRCNELIKYCRRHLRSEHNCQKELYRLFYYDCPPSEKNVWSPVTQKTQDLRKTEQYQWSKDFFEFLIKKRKVALRLGELLDVDSGYILRQESLKKLIRKEISVDDLTDNDFALKLTQKGIDTRISLDISSLAYKKLVDQIILIAGDSDFVPAAKHARREGIDFILDPMWHPIKESLSEHIDGMYTCVAKPPANVKDKLYTKAGVTMIEEENPTQEPLQKSSAEK